MAEYICPHCKKPVYDEEALLCLYCGESLGRSSGFMGGLKYTNPRVIAAVVALFIAACFLILIIK